jgi:hypothetical protein
MLWVIQRDFLQATPVQQLVADALSPFLATDLTGTGTECYAAEASRV